MEQQVKQSIARHKSGEKIRYKFYHIEDEILLIVDLLNLGGDSSPLLLRSVMYESWKKVSSWENAGWTLGRF